MFIAVALLHGLCCLAQVGNVVLVTLPRTIGPSHQEHQVVYEETEENDPEGWFDEDPEYWGADRRPGNTQDDPEEWDFEDPEVWGEYHSRRAPRPRPRLVENTAATVEPGMDPRWGALAAPGGDLWRVYAEVLKASAVGRRQEIDAGGKRESHVRLLYGSSGWTEVKQHGIRYQVRGSPRHCFTITRLNPSFPVPSFPPLSFSQSHAPAYLSPFNPSSM